MIKELEMCENFVVKNHGSYLLGSNVKKYGSDLLQGHAVLKNGVIDSLTTLGNLKTYTGVIPECAITGPNIPIEPQHEFNRDRKYLVKEQLPFMGYADIDDGGHIETIKDYMKKLENNEQLDMIITVLKQIDDFILVDGNKRTVAFYEYSKKREIKNINYQIYILEFKIA